ncbi:hypothetical protein JCM6882_005936 [Rhodosporidiobolus microsporus]
MRLPLELVAHILRLSADATFSPHHRRERLFRLQVVSHALRDLAQDELLRELFIDSPGALAFAKEHWKRENAPAVEAVTFFSRTAEGMLDLDKAVESLAELPPLKRLTIEFQPPKGVWEMLQIGEEATRKVDWSNLTQLTLIGVDVHFASPVPPFPSLLHLSLTASRLSLPPPYPAGSILPFLSLPALKHLSLRDIPDGEYRARESAMGFTPLYPPSHIVPVVAQLEALVLDYRLARALRFYPDEHVALFSSLKEAKTAVLWEFRECGDEAGAALQALRAFNNAPFVVQHVRFATAAFVKAFEQVLQSGKHLETVSFAASHLPTEMLVALDEKLRGSGVERLCEAVDEEGTVEREAEEFLKWGSRRRDVVSGGL